MDSRWNETKTRTLDVRRKGSSSSFCVSWRVERADGTIRHMEPHPKKPAEAADKLREKLNHWTLCVRRRKSSREVNRLLKGWGGYFSTTPTAHGSSIG